MSLFKRWFRGEPRPTAASSFSPETCLVGAGWQAGRSCDLANVGRVLTQAGFPLHEAARRLLGEYYGLRVDVPVAGADGITGFVHFAPEMVLRFLAPSDTDRLRALMPGSACPVGTAGGHTLFLFLDEDGRSYLLDMEWNLFAELADSPEETIRVLCDGRNGRVDSVVLDEGRPTPARITAENERQHWRSDLFPHTSPFLPPVSLSPARRPPTWRALVRTAEQALAHGGNPARLLVTCGGLTCAPSGRWYFVAHCENSLYVRRRAGFLVAAPPPGMPSGLRAGECVPFTPPPGWPDPHSPSAQR